MTSTLTEAEIAQMRADLEDIALPDTCTILSETYTEDGQGGGTVTWGTLSTGVKCRLDYSSGVEIVAGGALQPYSAYNLTVPYDAGLTAAHRVEVGTITYAVVEVDANRSWSLELKARVERV